MTILFCDVVGSTSLAETLEPETWGQVVLRYFERMRVDLERHGGKIEKYIGDAVLAVFGLPTAREDDALRAVRAADDMRASLRDLNQELRAELGIELHVRMGINTGEVVVADPSAEQTLPLGDAANVAARLEQAAGADQILMGERTLQLVRDAVRVDGVESLALKGKIERVAAYQLGEVHPSEQGRARRLDAPMVGREAELRLLLDAFESAVRERRARLITVVGPPGIGKSRLLREVGNRVSGRARALHGHCLPYGEGITYWPVSEILRQLVAPDEAVGAVDVRNGLRALLGGVGDGSLITERIAQVVGLAAGTASREEITWSLLRILEIAATRTPLVVVIEDVQWAEGSLVEMIEQIASRANFPMLILCSARPDIEERAPGLGTGSRGSVAVVLDGLSGAESERLVANLLGSVALQEDVRARVSAAAGGNPLFVEEFVGMLIDDGWIRRDEGSWIAAQDLAEVPVPPAISALLGARIDSLEREERDVIRRAAVIGGTFAPEAVEHLIPPAVRAGVRRCLGALVKRGYLEPEPTDPFGTRSLRFRHLLIRDAAYTSVPKQLRAELHEHFAGWLESNVEERPSEFEEVAGYHLEQAFRHRVELSPSGAGDGVLAARAAHHLMAAGHRARRRGDARAVVNLHSRAAALLPRDDPSVVALLPDIGAALIDIGDLAGAARVLEDAAARAELVGVRAEGERAQLYLGFLRAQTDPTSDLVESRIRAKEYARKLEHAGDSRALVEALQLVGIYSFWAGRAEEAGRVFERAIACADRSGDRRGEARNLLWLALTVWDGPKPVARGLDMLQEILVRSAGHSETQASVLCLRGGFQALKGQVGAARESIDRSKRVFEDLGLVTEMAGMLPATSALVERVAGDLGAAERVLRWGYDLLDLCGETGYLSTIAGELSGILHLQGRDDEALRFAEVSERSAAREDVMSQILWRISSARVLASRGDADEATRLAKEAVGIAASTDLLTTHGDALLGSAEVLSAGGDIAGATAAARRAATLYRRKGNEVGVSSALAWLSRWGHGAG